MRNLAPGTEKRFNPRVYGLWLHNGCILVNEEVIKGQVVVKFPGGGLEWGEGTIDGLKREFMEELQIAVAVTGHFYTTDFFQPSAYDNSQVLSIYYWVSGQVPAQLVNHVPNERTFWLPVDKLGEHTFTLPIDRKVGGLLRSYFDALPALL